MPPADSNKLINAMIRKDLADYIAKFQPKMGASVNGIHGMLVEVGLNTLLNGKVPQEYRMYEHLQATFIHLMRQAQANYGKEVKK